MAKRQRNVSVARGAPTHCGGGHNPLYPLLVSFDDLSWMLAGRDRTPETECRNFPGKQWFFSRETRLISGQCKESLHDKSIQLDK